MNATQQPIPGPCAWFSWRMNLLKFYRHPFSYSNWLHRNYGNLVALEKGNPSCVFAFGPDQNQEILTNPDCFEVNAATLARLPKNTPLGKMFLNNLLLMKGEKHKQHRRLMQPAFHRQSIIGYGDDMISLTRQMLNRWENQSSIDLNQEMKRLTRRIAVKTLFGLNDEAELDQMGAMIDRMSQSILYVALAPINLPGTPYHRALRIAEQMDNYVRSMIEQKRTQSSATDVLATLVQARDEDGSVLSEDELIGHIFTLFVAGHETTSNALTWTIFLLSQHPDILSDLLDELEDAIQGDSPTMEKLNQLPLLEGVVKESLRLLPPASIGMRITGAPCELGGFSLPKGSHIFYSPFITHRMPELYSKPNRFQPKRWMGLKRSPFEFLPFGAGPHMCIGWAFAMQEMKVVLAMLLQRVRLQVVDRSKVHPNLNMRPKYGMPMCLFPQDRQFQRADVRGSIHQLIDFHN